MAEGRTPRRWCPAPHDRRLPSGSRSLAFSATRSAISRLSGAIASLRLGGGIGITADGGANKLQHARRPHSQNKWMGCFKHTGCNNCEPHDSRLVSRVRSGDSAADSRIDDETYENEGGEDNGTFVCAIPLCRGGRASRRRNKMDCDYTEGKKARYRDA